MNTYDLVVSARFERSELERISDSVPNVRYAGYGVTGEKLPEDALIAALEGADLFVLEFEQVSRRVLETASKLKAIGCCRTGPEANVDIGAATELGIPVLYTPGRNAVSVAEYTIGLMISVARHLAEAYHLLRYTEDLTEVHYSDKTTERLSVTSEWSIDPRAPFNRFQGPELSGKTIGLVGFGAIAREIAVRARAFNMAVTAYDPYVSANAFGELGATSVSLDEVAGGADFVVMAAKVTPETTGMFSRRHFSLMKPTAYFINTARAAVVDYKALHEALAQKRIAGAALDVFTEEPMLSTNPLRALSNVLISPHLAGASRDIPRHHSRIMVDDLALVLSGKRPRFLKNPEVWDRRRPL
jgi:D-3-phosphoglycerate dehydrogenase